MSESNYTPDQNMDEKLANFADQALSGITGDTTMSSQDLELQKLQDMVLLLHQATTNSQKPPEEMRTRIQSRLEDAWKQNNPSPARSSLLQTISTWFEVHQRQLVYSGATLVILLVVFAFIPDLVNNALTGSAGTPSVGEPAPTISYGLLVPIAFAAAAVMWFLTRSKE